MEKELVACQEKLKKYYEQDGKLTQYPSRKPMRILALIKIAEKFDPAEKYTEKEVNEIIRNSIAFSDIELIRREMFQYRFIGRLRDGSEYWAEENWRKQYQEYL